MPLTTENGYILVTEQEASGSSGAPSIPAVPLGLMASAGIGVVSLRWTPYTDDAATTLRLVRTGDTATVNFDMAPVVDSFADTSVIGGTTYSYHLIARGDAGDSDDSTTVVVTPLAVREDHFAEPVNLDASGSPTNSNAIDAAHAVPAGMKYDNIPLRSIVR